MSDVIVTSTENFRNEVRYGNATLITDEPASAGGEDAGPDPYTLLLAALGSCISLTTTMYARRKGWPLKRVIVRLRQQRTHANDCKDCQNVTDEFIHRIERSVSFEGDLNDEQRKRLQEISHKCPLHRTLTSQIVIAELDDNAVSELPGNIF